MNEIWRIVAGAIVAFVATNIDDIIVLLLFFSQVSDRFHRRHIVFGQYLGFTALILASLPGYFGGLVVSKEWIGLLGIVPIAIGIKQLFSRSQEETEVQTININLQSSSSKNKVVVWLASLLNPQTYKVAAVTFANGGDNISIYIPLFAGSNLANLGATLGVFFFMVGVWCYIAYLLTRNPGVAYVLTRYGKPLVPFVLIGLGLFIMYERGSFVILALIKFNILNTPILFFDSRSG